MLRRPLRVLYESIVTSNAASTQVDSKLLDLYDYDSVLVKAVVPICTGGSVSVVVQTTDDEGTTWYDCGNLSFAAVNTSATAKWMVLPVKTGYSVYIANANASSTTINTITGLPLLSPYVRIAYHTVLGVTALNAHVTLYANNQDRA